MHRNAARTHQREERARGRARVVRAFRVLRDLRVDHRGHAPVVHEPARAEDDALRRTVVAAGTDRVREVVVARVDVERVAFADGDADGAARFVLDHFVDDRVLPHDAALREEVAVKRKHHGNAGRDFRRQGTDLRLAALDEGRGRELAAALQEIVVGVERVEAERLGERRVVEAFAGLEGVLEEEFGRIVRDAVLQLLGRARNVDPEAGDRGVAAVDGHLLDHDHFVQALVERFVPGAGRGDARAHDDRVELFVPLDVLGGGDVARGGVRGGGRTHQAEAAQGGETALEEGTFLHVWFSFSPHRPEPGPGNPVGFGGKRAARVVRFPEGTLRNACADGAVRVRLIYTGRTV